MEELTKYGPAIGVVLAILVLLIYLVAAFLALFLKKQPLHDAFMKNPAANIGIPCSAFASFVIVASLWAAFTPKDPGGELKLKFFNLDFTGPAGPIGLWVVCFLSLILALRLLKLPRP